MKKRIQKRTDHIHWLDLIRQDAITKQDRLMKSKDRNQDEINRLEKVIQDCKEEIRRYNLVWKVCGNPMTVLV